MTLVSFNRSARGGGAGGAPGGHRGGTVRAVALRVLARRVGPGGGGGRRPPRPAVCLVQPSQPAQKSVGSVLLARSLKALKAACRELTARCVGWLLLLRHA